MGRECRPGLRFKTAFNVKLREAGDVIFFFFLLNSFPGQLASTGTRGNGDRGEGQEDLIRCHLSLGWQWNPGGMCWGQHL